jgi:hypothetical protein
MKVSNTSEKVIEFGLNFHTVRLIRNPSKTMMTILKPTLSVNLSIPEISRFPGNMAEIKAYPGTKNININAKGILNGVSLKGGTRINTIDSNDIRYMIFRSWVYLHLFLPNIYSLVPVSYSGYEI